MNAPDILQALADARSHASLVGGRRRVVLRMGKSEVAQVDALRVHFPNASRAALIRTLTLYAIVMVDAALSAKGAPPAEERPHEPPEALSATPEASP